MNAEHGADFAPSAGGAAADVGKREVWPAIRRGLRCRCPNCGERTLFTSYLKVADRCAACGEELHHHRADDMPPWLTLVIVCHVLGVGVLSAHQAWDIPTWVDVIVWPALAAALSLALLPSMKGAVVALQWALRMHGFSARS